MSARSPCELGSPTGFLLIADYSRVSTCRGVSLEIGPRGRDLPLATWEQHVRKLQVTSGFWPEKSFICLHLPPLTQPSFLREVMKVLRHKNLINFYQAIETTSRVYIILELAQGGDVLEWVQRYGACSEPLAGKWFSQMSLGIAYLHSKGIVHRSPVQCLCGIMGGSAKTPLSPA